MSLNTYFIPSRGTEYCDQWWSLGIFSEAKAVRTFSKARPAEAAEMRGKAEAASLLVEANAQVMGFVLADP